MGAKPLVWDPGMSVGHPLLDRQHRSIVKTINELLEDPDLPAHAEKLNDVLQGLQDYIHFHFTDEERLLAEGGFPGLADHAARHHQFEEKLLAFTEELMARRPGVARELALFLEEWWSAHILVEDMAYKDFLPRSAG